MTDVTENRGQAETELSAADEQLLRELTERARTSGLRLTGEGGLLGRLTKMVIEGALEGELDDHLGYCKHDPEGAELVNLSDRVVRPPHRPEPVGDGLEAASKMGSGTSFSAAWTTLSATAGTPRILVPRPARLGNLAFPHRQRPERARFQLGPQIIQELLDTDALFDQPDGHAVHAGRVRAPVALDPAVRHIQRRRIMHEVEQVIEPAARIGRRPAVKLGLHPRYP